MLIHKIVQFRLPKLFEGNLNYHELEILFLFFQIDLLALA